MVAFEFQQSHELPTHVHLFWVPFLVHKWFRNYKFSSHIHDWSRKSFLYLLSWQCSNFVGCLRRSSIWEHLSVSCHVHHKPNLMIYQRWQNHHRPSLLYQKSCRWTFRLPQNTFEWWSYSIHTQWPELKYCDIATPICTR